MNPIVTRGFAQKACLMARAATELAAAAGTRVVSIEVIGTRVTVRDSDGRSVISLSVDDKLIDYAYGSDTPSE